MSEVQNKSGALSAVVLAFAVAAGLGATSLVVKAGIDKGCELGAKAYDGFRNTVYPSVIPR